MNKPLRIFLFLACLLASYAAQAQSTCRFTFKGTLAGKAVTMCFFPDDSDGNVNGEYYYGKGANGVMRFTGTAIPQKDGSYKQKLEESNAQGTVTGYFIGKLKGGEMTGMWTSADGSRTFPYKLILQK